MKFKRLSGFIEGGALGCRRVDGWAVQIEGWEWLHTWVTPHLGLMDFTVSHWESGLNFGVFANTKNEVVRLVDEKLKRYGQERIREIVAPWR